MRIGSICTGLGRLDAAVASLLSDPAIIWCAEPDPLCRKVLAMQVPPPPLLVADDEPPRLDPGPPSHLYHDARQARDADGVDVLVGGTPCQDLSTAGRRAGADGERSSLLTIIPDLADRRIIPARAGFTASRVRARVRVADHPRSRGVYGPLARPAGSLLGSSPLARGLRVAGARRVRTFGIIPARAGFTPRRHQEDGGLQDHPRSRGVYRPAALRMPTASGSSPLARGLLLAHDVATDYFGIIPARAGFTSRGPSAPAGRRDHPRSRGVYASPCPSRPSANGSSPLARGLPGRVPR